MSGGAYPVSPRRKLTSLPVRYAFLFAVALCVLAADQIVKLLIASWLHDGALVDLLGGRLRLDYTRNFGAAFGVYRGGGLILVLVAVVVSIGIVMYYQRLAQSPTLVRLALGLVLGGAVGNLIDRVRLGYVVDFIDLRWWPVFNLADSAIVIGVALLLLHSVMQPVSRPR